jgi:single-strand DNA-binding protein
VGELEICDLRVAIPRRKGRDGSDRGAVFIDVTAFGPLASTCGKYLAKGRRVAVNGRLELEEWEASDGSPRRRHKVVADQVEFLDPSGRPNGEPVDSADGPADEVAAKREQHDESTPAEPVAA